MAISSKRTSGELRSRRPRLIITRLRRQTRAASTAHSRSFPVAVALAAKGKVIENPAVPGSGVLLIDSDNVIPDASQRKFIVSPFVKS